MKKLIFQVILSLSGILAFAGHTFAQPLTNGAVSGSKMTPTVQMSMKEFAERKERLLQSKNVDRWVPKGGSRAN